MVLGRPGQRRVDPTLSAHGSGWGCAGVAGWTGLDASTKALARQYGQASGFAGLSEGGDLAGFGETGAAASVGAGSGDTGGVSAVCRAAICAIASSTAVRIRASHIERSWRRQS